MSRQFGMVTTSIWNSRRFHRLKSDNHRLAYIYLLANTHGNSIGAYRLPLAYMADDMSTPDHEVSMAASKTAMADMCAVGLVDYDTDEKVVCIKGWFDHNPIMNRKHLQGSVRAFQSLPKSTSFAAQIVLEISYSMILRARSWNTDEKGHKAANDALEMVSIFCREAIGQVGDDKFLRVYHTLPRTFQTSVSEALSIPLLIPISIDVPIDRDREADSNTDSNTDSNRKRKQGSQAGNKPVPKSIDAQALIASLNDKSRAEDEVEP